jgi:hypothetical protein
MSDKPPYDRELQMSLLTAEAAVGRVALGELIVRLMQLSAMGEPLGPALKQVYQHWAANEIEEHFDLVFELLRGPIDTAVEQLKKEEKANEQR